MKAIHFDKKSTRHLESEKSDLSLANLCSGMGLLTTACLIGYFFLMSAFKLQEVLSLRAFNFVILLAGILWTFHLYNKANETSKVDYFTGLKLGIRVTFVAVISFAIFMALYLVYDNHLMDVIKENTGIGQYLNPLTIAGAICMEGLSSGFIITFIAMQYFKNE